MPAGDIWVRDDKLVENLVSVVDTDIQNISELVEFEKGLRFAVLKLKDLTMLKYEYLANPFYLSDKSKLGTTQSASEQLSTLTDTLIDIDNANHKAIHQKILSSW